MNAPLPANPSRLLGSYRLLQEAPSEADLPTSAIRPGGSPCWLFALPPGAIGLERARARIGRHHPNLVEIVDAGRAGSQAYIATSAVEGRQLDEVLARCKSGGLKLAPSVVLLIGQSVVAALEYARRQHAAQATLHPRDVCLSWKGEVRLLELGCQGLHRDDPYRAPEVVPGGRIDGRSDAYAVGQLLLQLLQLADSPLPKIEALAKDCSKPSPPDRPSSLQLVYTRLRDAGQGDARTLGMLIGELYGAAIASELAERDQRVAELGPVEGGKSTSLNVDPRGQTQMSGGASEPAKSEARELTSPDAMPPVAGAVTAEAPAVPTKKTRVSQPVDRERFSEAPRHLTGPVLEPPEPDPHDERALTPPHALTQSRDSHPGRILTPPPGSEEIQAGQTIDGRYLIERILGTGGMGAVYEAEHVDIGKKVAIKILHPQLSKQADLVARFRREARAASRIGHPNIVDVTDFGQTPNGNVYFVMERLEGVDLAEVLRHERRLAPDRAVHIGVQICRALAAAHTAGIIHRDLKPENIFLIPRDGNSDFVKVLDFGIAKSDMGNQNTTRRLTTPGIAMGTPEYMAPEQAAGKPIDGRVDIYAVGAMLYELITSRPPHSGNSVMEILAKKANNNPRPIRETNPECPPALEKVILQCLEREPILRPQTMSQLEYELNKSMRGRGSAVAAVLGLKVDDAQPVQWTEEPSVRPAALPPAPAAALSAPPTPPTAAAPPPPPPAAMNTLAIGLANTLPPMPAPATEPRAPTQELELEEIEDVETQRGAPSFDKAERTIAQPPMLPTARSRGLRALPFVLVGALGLIAIVAWRSTGTSPSAQLRPPPVAPAPAAASAAPPAAPAVAAPTPSAPVATAPAAVDPAAPSAAAAPAAAAPGTATPGAPGPAAAAPAPGSTAPQGPAAPTTAPAPAPAAPAPDVGPLLEWAKRAAEGNRIYAPPGDNLKELLERIEKTSPQNAEAAALRKKVTNQLRNKGVALLRSRNADGAERALRGVLALEEDDSLAKQELAKALVVGAEQKLDAKKPQLALNAAQEALVLDPQNGKAPLVEAQALLALHRPKEAAVIYERVLEGKPRDQQALRGLQSAKKAAAPRHRK